MKFQTTHYHKDLLKDDERLSAFYDAIQKHTDLNLAYDLGSGSGVMAYFLKDICDEIISLEIDSKAYECSKNNLKNFKNIEVVNEDVLNYEFLGKADLIVCEMLDTALIDEEQIPVINYARQFLKENGRIIPEAIINIAELVSMERNYIHWDENSNYHVLSDSVKYSKFDFKEYICPDFEKDIEFRINTDSTANGIKLTTITLLDDEIVCGPTPMLNPPLLIPIDEIQVKCNDLINVKLKYIMGAGIETVSTQLL